MNHDDRGKRIAPLHHALLTSTNLPGALVSRHNILSLFTTVSVIAGIVQQTENNTGLRFPIEHDRPSFKASESTLYNFRS